MKTLAFLFLPFILFSCCLGNRKCNGDYYSSRFRLINNISGQDLVFGQAKIYDKEDIRFYSLNGTDTIFHYYSAGPNPNPGQDSLLFVSFDPRKYETVFLELNNTDIDTLKILYQLVNNSQCCSDYIMAVPHLFNNKLIGQIAGGITILKK